MAIPYYKTLLEFTLTYFYTQLTLFLFFIYSLSTLLKKGVLMKTKEICLCGLFVALIGIGAFLKVPVPVVPFTLQFLFTLMAALLLGSRLGAVAVSIYVVLGLVGLPIFAEGGGLWYILKPSFGYLLGFILGTYVTGKLVERHSALTFANLFRANFTGLLVVYGCGMVYYYLISSFVINQPIALWPLFLYCFLLAVPGDIVLCAVGASLAKKLRPVLQNLN